MKLVLDFDGTVTERDTLEMVLTQFGDQQIYDHVESELGLSLTLNEVITAEFATVTAPLDEVVPWLLAQARVRPGFRELAERHRPLIVSSGFRQLIEPLLEREGVLELVELRAHNVDARPDGWRVRFRHGDTCGTCGEPCKRADLPQGDEVVYVGDAYSDRCAALAADRVFATAGLAAYLTARGTPFEPFEDFVDLNYLLVTASS
ncbi:MAG: haloacid dehalogenase-like hydrolase [Actinomycetota bacterium]|nr:haloacid dehalogenase-like hydrolase [Actinomycetota bacterium]